MNPEKGKGEDVDPHGMTPSNARERTRRQRNSPLLSNNNDLCPSSNYHRDNPLQQPTPPPPPPQYFRQRQPRYMHYRGNENPRPVKPPPPAQTHQWQYFARYRPFGDSVRPYQFPPPPHFPQQFQFGTFPGRNSPRFRHRRENMAARGAIDNNVNNDNVTHPNSNLHNNHPDIPHDGDVVRPKSGPFLNGKKKSNKYKHHSHSHDYSRSSKIRKDSSRHNETSQTFGHVDNVSSLCGVSDSLKDNLVLAEDKGGIKVSKSCDESWLNKMACDGSMSSVPDELDAQGEVEGAVGGLPLNTNGTLAEQENNSPLMLDKDLIDEGAIFDLDNIFQNHEISQKGDSCFANGGLDCGDDLDFDFDYESKREFSDVESHSREGCGGGHGPLKSWSDRKKKLHHTHNDMNSFVNINNGNRSGIHVHDVQRNDNSNNNSNLHDDNGIHDVADSGGEDTGDFIDTDLPSHANHILSSSDEMDNQSSAKESDDDDEKTREDRQHSATKNKESSQSDFNSNDLSTLEPHLLNSLSHLSMKTSQSTERRAKTDDVSNRHNFDGCAYCDLKENDLSSAEKSSKPTRHCMCRGNVNSRRACSFPHAGFTIGSDASRTTVYGAAADNIPPPAPGNLCFPNHPGANCELPSSVGQCSHSRSVNTGTHSPLYSHCQHHGQCVSSEHSESSASGGGGGRCVQPLESHHQCCPLGSNASGTSVVEGQGTCHGCFSHNPTIGSNVGSACHHQHNSYGRMPNGLVSNEVNQGLPSSSCLRDFPVAGEMGDHKATISASAAEKELDENSDLLMMMMNMESSSSSSSSVAGGMEDPMMNFDGNGDHVDMVLLPMEEEIEPVLYGGGGDTDFEEDEERMMVPQMPAVGFMTQRSTTANSLHHSMAGPSHCFEECHGPHIRDPISIGNRLPSKEFYELIKTVSSTDSCMRFFDKDGQDVQRSTQKTSNDEDTPSSTKGSGKHSKRSSGSKGDTVKVDRVMIWNEYEAYVVQYKQIAVSACGQTAVLNVLKALKFQCEKSVVCKVIKTNLRKEDKDIPEYLFSRTCAGTTAVELMSGVEKLTGGVIGGRFFHFWPPRKVKLLQWLAYWMKRGAIPMATLNLQQGPHSVWEVPDSWHHQMVYGVSHQGLYLTNPLEIVSERSAVKQLHSDSVLLVRRQDIVSRFRESTDLGQLLDHPDPRWMSMNVLGQVVNVLRECNMPSVPGYRLQVTSHVKIPASYQAGITLFMRKDQPAWNVLVTASELPLE